jgi:hypothetical protein
MRSLNWKAHKRQPLAVLAAYLVGLSVFAFADSARAEPWAKHQASLSAQAAKIKSHEEEIKKLIALKKQTHDSTRLKEIVGTLGEQHSSLVDLSKEYEDERLHVRFQHPEKADTADRKYIHYDVRSLEEMESDIGMSGRLDRIKARVLVTFPLLDPKPSAASKVDATARKPASDETENDKPEQIHLVK